MRLTSRKLRASAIVTCGSLMIGDVDSVAVARSPRTLPRRLTTAFHGTYRAGFEARVRFRCQVRSPRSERRIRYTLRCQNKLGDKYTYAFTATRPRLHAKGDRRVQDRRCVCRQPRSAIRGVWSRRVSVGAGQSNRMNAT